MDTRLATIFTTDSLRMILFLQDKIPHKDLTPIKYNDTSVNTVHINALFSNPQADPIQPDTIALRNRRPIQESNYQSRFPQPPVYPPATSYQHLTQRME